jgi:GAF domain-containing protein
MHDDPLSMSLHELARLLYAEITVEETLNTVAHLAVASLDGCDAAGVTLKKNGNGTTTAATDEVVLSVDEAQYQTGEGPCLQAMREAKPFFIDSMARDTRFPRYTPLAIAAGIRSSMTFPLQVHDETIGALNLYSRAERAFRESDHPLALIFAAQASVGLLNVRTYDDLRKMIRQLEEGLKTREVIGRATGVLMAREDLSAEAAFSLLTAASQHSNTKVRDIAVEILTQHERSIPPVD